MRMVIEQCTNCKNLMKEKITLLWIRHIKLLPMEFLCEKCGKEFKKIETEMLTQNRKNKVEAI